MQAMTANVFNFDPSTSGLQLIPDTYHALGNDGNVPYMQDITSSPTAFPNLYRNGSLSWFIERYKLQNDLRWASGHLPVVADYSLGPGTSTWNGMALKMQWSGLQGQSGNGQPAVSNWDSQPIDGDNLIFKGPFSGTVTNDYLTNVGSITFPNNASSTPFHLGGNALTISGGITNNSNFQQFINLNLTLSAPQQFSLATNNVTNGLVFTGAIDNGGNLLTLSALGRGMNLYGVVSGTGGLVVQQLQQSSIPFLIAGNNTYSGGTTVIGPYAGSANLMIGNDHALGTGTLTVTGAVIDVAGFNLTVGGLNGDGGIYSSLQSGTLTVGSGDQDGSFSGGLGFDNTLKLVKVGSGTQILSGGNSLVGGIVVNGGTLKFGNDLATRSTPGGMTVNSGGTLDLNGFSPSVGALNGNGGIVKNAAAGVATLKISNSFGNGTYAGTIADGVGTLAVTKSGSGQQLLTGDNTYSGGTTVTGGTLVVGSPTALGTGGLTISSSFGSSVAQLQAGLSRGVVLPNLSIDSSTDSTLDLTDNSLVVHSGDLATLTSQVQSGLNRSGALWTGAGITSSTAAVDSNGITAVGIIPNDDGSGGALYGTWPVGADSGGAVSVTNTDVLIKYTYYGDADLDGVVNAGQDYDLWLAGKSGPAPAGSMATLITTDRSTPPTTTTYGWPAKPRV